jgi:hypothetical protein
MSPFSMKTRINWDKEYLPVVRDQLADLDQQGLKADFRGMYYTLVQLGILPKTQQSYQQLNKVSVRWRERGLIPLDAFTDSTRRIRKNDFEYEPHEDYVYRGIYHLENATKKYEIPLWYGQPHYVEIWLEKNAAVNFFQSIVKDLEVIVVPNRGNSSVDFFNDNVERLKQKQREGKQIHILYFGDEDPSGEMMDGVYKRKFTEPQYGLYDVEFKRYGVTKDQKERFDLLTDPDPETLKKLQKDSNRFKFMEKYGLFKESEDSLTEYIFIDGKRYESSKTIEVLEGGRFLKHDPTKLFAIQLEAMETPNVRAYLKVLVTYVIGSYFDPKIRKKILKEHPKENLSGLVLLEVGLLKDRLEAVAEEEHEDE